VIKQNSFVKHFLRFYTGTLEQKFRFVFDLYDFSHSGMISKEDTKIILMHCPIYKEKKLEGFLLSPTSQQSNKEIPEGKLVSTQEQKSFK